MMNIYGATNGKINLISVGLILAISRISEVEFARMLDAANELNRQQVEEYDKPPPTTLPQ